MSSIICPTVLADTAEAFQAGLDNVAFAQRIQIDLMDGEFAPTKSVNPAQIYWNDDQQADVHLMFQRPVEHIETLIALKPSLVILHAESDGDLSKMFDDLSAVGIKTGLCVLPETQVEDVKELIVKINHLLVFGGKLGYYGGKADLSQAEKAKQAKVINSAIEVGWDGGANESNAKQLADAGIDVINVGSGIQKADDPEQAYESLTALVS